jgi:hypothetical protein
MGEMEEEGEGEGEGEGEEEDEGRGAFLLVTGRGAAGLAALPASALRPALEHLWRGLRRLGENGVVYRDLHAGNVLLGEDGLPRLVDFADCELGADPGRAEERHRAAFARFVEQTFGGAAEEALEI